MLNLIFSLIGGSIIGGLTGTHIIVIIYGAIGRETQNYVVVPLALLWTLVGGLVAYSTVPVCICS